MNKERDNLAVLNCTSASLFELARNSQLYKEALSGCEKTLGWCKLVLAIVFDSCSLHKNVYGIEKLPSSI